MLRKKITRRGRRKNLLTVSRRRVYFALILPNLLAASVAFQGHMSRQLYFTGFPLYPFTRSFIRIRIDVSEGFFARVSVPHVILPCSLPPRA